MHLDFLFDRFKEYKNNIAIINNTDVCDYNILLRKVNKCKQLLSNLDRNPGAILELNGDFESNSIAFLLASIDMSYIIVPFSSTKRHKDLFEIACIENEYYNILRKRNCPGLVLFTSGTSGKPKAVVHDFSLLLEKFKTKRKSLRTLNFLLFDHWGGLNTMFHILSNGGTLIATKDRSPKNICKLIEMHKVELLPTSPTFLNLFLISGAYNDYDLSSLKIISYGTEPMPINTLRKLKELFPNIKLLQTYGLIELGVMQSKSEGDDSLWVKIGGDGYETRIVDGILQVKAKSAMLGYLNAPSPFTDDGWFITGDEVIQKDGYIKILGRKSEIINVGGNKVYPQEVENTILEIDNVAETIVYNEKHFIMGNIVCAKVRLQYDEDKNKFIDRLKKYCSDRLEKYKVPIKVQLVDEVQYTKRFKKQRV